MGLEGRLSNSRRLLRSRGVRVAATLAVLGVVYALVLPRITRYGAVWDELRTLTGLRIAALAAVAGLNVTTSAFPWMTIVPGLSFVTALRVTQTSTALIAVLPGGAPMGMAVSFGILRSLGGGSDSAGFGVVLTGLWNQVAIFVFPVVGLVLVSATGETSGVIAAVAVAGAVLAVVIAGGLGLALSTEARAHRVGELLRTVVALVFRLLRKGPPAWEAAALARLRHDGLRLLRHRWGALTLATLANLLTGYLLLEASLRAVGIGFGRLSVAETFAAWSLGRLIGSLPLTPAGIGLVELGLVGTLIGFGGPGSRVVAGVLLFRALVLVPTLAVGSLSALTLRVRRAPG